jgi:hypothetical protein
MWQDPIVTEIHQTRERISQSYGNDLHAIFMAAQRGELSKPLASVLLDVAEIIALVEDAAHCVLPEKNGGQDGF